MELRDLRTEEEMMTCLELLQTEYPDMTEARFREMLREMIPCNYAILAAFEGNTCLGANGYWINTKIWCGRYLELDNIVVHPDHRSKGIGKLMFNEIERIAQTNNCHLMTLDAYTTNFKAHKLYYNLGFVPRGFHFIKWFSDAETDANGYRTK